nr:hypothetical protein [Tanacetum cinerariifolium]
MAAKDIWDRVKMMNMQQVQVNTKFLNALPLEWSKFVTDVKLAKSLYTTKYDQLYAYRSQHERHANQFCITRKRYSDPLAFLANSLALFNPSQSPQLSALRFPPLNNQLRTSSNPRNQATIQDGRVIVQQVQRRQNQSYAGIEHRVIATTSKGNIAAGQQRVMKSEAQEAGQILDEEQLAFLADPDDLDASDSDCDDLSSAKAVLMLNLSSSDPEVLFEVPYFDSCSNDMNQDVQRMWYFEQTHVDDF